MKWQESPAPPYYKYGAILIGFIIAIITYQKHSPDLPSEINTPKKTISLDTLDNLETTKISKSKPSNNASMKKLSDSNNLITLNVDSLNAISNEKNPFKSRNADSYIPIQDITFTKKTKTYKINFKTPLQNYISLILIGKNGQIQLLNTKVQFSTGNEKPILSVDKDYFENDWYRLETNGEAITAITFQGKSISEEGALTLYLQK